jgi:hypothetical protein
MTWSSERSHVTPLRYNQDMDTSPLYTVAGTDLGDFVREWIAESQALEHQGRLLAEADADPQSQDSAWTGTSQTMSCIAPRCWGAAGSREELLLLAVLATYQGVQGHDDPPWPGIHEYVRRAFTYMHEIGEQEAARLLRAGVARRASTEYQTERSRFFRDFVRGGDDPVRMAEQDLRLAPGSQRDLRAAEALDPQGQDWDDFLQRASPE